MSISPNPDQHNEAKIIISQLGQKLKQEFANHRTQHMNPNVKGMGYETITVDFLKPYLNSLFTFHSRAKLVDYLMTYVNAFPQGRNEWDVVATYNNAIPALVLPGFSSDTLPLDAVAFVVEVAQDVNTAQLVDDLDHFHQLDTLPICEHRTGMSFVSQYSVGRPIKVILYDDRKILPRTILRTLNKRVKDFDLMLIVSKDELYISQNLPFRTAFTPLGGVSVINGDSILLMIISLLASIPTSIVFNILPTTMNLYYASKKLPMNP